MIYKRQVIIDFRKDRAKSFTVSKPEDLDNFFSRIEKIAKRTRGFLYAGCNSIVASLWKVDDLATATLMVDFYSGLNRMNKQQALRTAQLMTKKKYAHPYYWASFQLTGSAK